MLFRSYQVGTGVMIGLPFQTFEDLADDLLFLKEMDIDMCGMGPYIEHEHTPLYQFRHLLKTKKERFDLALNMIAVLRLIMPDINIAAATALQAIDTAGREKALEKLLPMQRSDFEGIFEAMAGYGVTIRLLDPPLHEFVPHEEANQLVMAKEMGISVEQIKQKVDGLHEFNPMLGHRGCRLGITYPEITAMQARAIIEAAMNLKAKGVDARPEIMVPLVGTVAELKNQTEIIRSVAEKVFAEKGDRIAYQVEIGRAHV